MRSPNNPYLFIVGCPRSGTTLLQRMVNAHHKIAITPESHWIPRLYGKPWAVNSQGTVTSKLIRRLLAKSKFARLKLAQDVLTILETKTMQISYSELVTMVFDSYGNSQGKPLVGDKTPDYVRTIPVLHALWPEAKFVHVIRDGRDVALSMMEWSKVHPKPGDFVTWQQDRITTAALWWELNVRSGQNAGKALGHELYHEIRYDSLVSQPELESKSLCDFLGVTYDSSMLSFHETSKSKDPGLEAKRVGLPITPGLRDWRSQMIKGEIELFEAAAGELLDELGYSRMTPSPNLHTLENAARLRTVLMHDPRIQD